MKGKTSVKPAVDFKLQFEPGSNKAAASEAGAKATDVMMVPIEAIKIVGDFNVRIHDEEYEAHVNDIKESIRANGFFRHMPLKGYVGKEGDQNFYFLTGGFSRFEASKRAIAEGVELAALPMVITPPGTNMIDLMMGIDQDNTGARLRPYERAIVVKRAIGYGATEEDVAKRMNISGQYISDLLYALTLPNSLQTMIVIGKASLGTVVATARKLGIKEAVVALAAAGDKAATAAAGKTGKTPKAGKVTAKSVAAATGAFNPSRKHLGAAIRYALDMVTDKDGVDWLRKWIVGDADTVKELKAIMRKGNAVAAESAAVNSTRAAKAAAKAAKANGGAPKLAVARDPLDIDTGDTAGLGDSGAAPPAGTVTDDEPL